MNSLILPTQKWELTLSIPTKADRKKGRSFPILLPVFVASDWPINQSVPYAAQASNAQMAPSSDDISNNRNTVKSYPYRDTPFQVCQGQS